MIILYTFMFLWFSFIYKLYALELFYISAYFSASLFLTLVQGSIVWLQHNQSSTFPGGTNWDCFKFIKNVAKMNILVYVFVIISLGNIYIYINTHVYRERDRDRVRETERERENWRIVHIKFFL